MKNITFKKSGPKLSESKLKSLETQLGCKLPKDYRAFLLKHNGGTPDKSYFHVPGMRYDPDPQIVFLLLFVDDHLAEPSDSADVYSIAHHRYYYKEVCPHIIPDDCLIIGMDDRCNYLLLRLSGPRRGEIAFKIVGEEGEPDENVEDFLYPVAESFSDFLKKLKLTMDECHSED